MVAFHLCRAIVLGSCSLLIWAVPSQARFLQGDPVGYDDQINLYAYVANDPINMTDPTGAVRCSNDPRCEAVHAAATEARGIAQRGASDLRSLAQAVESGAELNETQAGLRGASSESSGRHRPRQSTM